MLSNRTTRRVEWGDCDPAGIVFNPNFFRWFDHATTMLYEAAGWPKQEMVARFGIVGCPLVDSHAKFRAPCRYGDEIAIMSEIAEIRRSSFLVQHVLALGGRTCVEATDTRVWTGRDAESGRLAALPLPDEVVARFRDGAP